MKLNNVNNLLTFLGRGNAFNYKEDNTSACFIKNHNFYLFDAGQKIATKIIHYNLINKDVKKVIIFITHLHPDHISSLPELLTYLYLSRSSDLDIKVIYKDKDSLLDLLSLLNYDFPINILDSYKDEYLDIKIMNQVHTKGSYGYLVNIYNENYSFFYSGDTSVINEEVLELFNKDKLDMMYHEVSKTQNKFHTGILTLNKYIDINKRNKVTLMHFEDDEIINECIKEGYKVAIVNLK